MITVKDALEMITKEYYEACKEFSSFNSAHEGYAVIEEELDELWEKVKKKPQSITGMTKEAIQVGAMALRFIIDVCGEGVK